MANVFKTMTLNIRLDVKSDSLDNWHLRKKRNRSVFQNKDPKIIGLQEALLHQLQYMDSSLVHYVSVGEGRDGQQKENILPLYSLTHYILKS